ncbi:hypothetical protein HYH02_004388 [Chlamydomonas schloesseri]|uniref:Uncharacterized protein n=1 Tax=Chlamydomonas schloesseri TaxID=2026947 RepID=A0A835VU77_9CHLO|nr:hypothetical protein HYH02_014889 [Chlamydomonas schloesseri]KAG2451120.1 hypothetical protein HYH02_004388 [Chlamydomonas schloesseri]|eukprot:KAG2426028.1 hypothetical protein HYH02_014889 [Chlamydomonas schloesseri]
MNRATCGFMPSQVYRTRRALYTFSTPRRAAASKGPDGASIITFFVRKNSRSAASDQGSRLLEAAEGASSASSSS